MSAPQSKHPAPTEVRAGRSEKAVQQQLSAAMSNAGDKSTPASRFSQGMVAELRALLDKATQGPWRMLGEYIDSPDRPPPIAASYYSYATAYGGEFHEQAKANGEAIVAAVNALPALLSRIEELETAGQAVLEERIQAAWDSVETLPAIVFSEAEERALAAALLHEKHPAPAEAETGRSETANRGQLLQLHDTGGKGHSRSEVASQPPLLSERTKP